MTVFTHRHCFSAGVWGGSKGLLTFLGFLGNSEFSPWKRLPEFTKAEAAAAKTGNMGNVKA